MEDALAKLLHLVGLMGAPSVKYFEKWENYSHKTLNLKPR